MLTRNPPFFFFFAAVQILQGFAYMFRTHIKDDDLPAAVTARQACWYGVECRTQFHNPGHATRYSHVGQNISQQRRR